MSNEALYRAERAKALLDDPLITDAFARLERLSIEEMLIASNTDEQRRVCADRVNAARWVRDALKMIIGQANPIQQQEIDNLP